ncbi:hypothetical protein V6Z11_D08G082200 [Gossypium hirsutum]
MMNNIRYTCSMERSVNEFRTNPVICLFQFNFYDLPVFVLLLLHGMNYLLSNKNIIRDIPTCDKTSLLLRDYPWQNNFEPVSNNFHHQFIVVFRSTQRILLLCLFRLPETNVMKIGLDASVVYAQLKTN